MIIDIVTIVGARPQFVKAAAVSRAFSTDDEIREIIVHTGQHFDDNMSGVFFDELGIPKPDHNLGVGGGTHASNTGRIMEALEPLLLNIRPDCVLVYGDTDSTLAGALTAAKIHIPVIHVEAGLRSFNRRMPEEVNRVLTDHISTILFAPSQDAMVNLRKEGISDDTVFMCGDVMLDVFNHFMPRALAESSILVRTGLSSGQYCLATVHRQENTDNPARLASILEGLSSVSMPVLLPLHPRTRQRISSSGLAMPDTIQIIDPVGYLDMVALQTSAKVIATDSGGVQKEAFFSGVPCITLRDETEWKELVEVGANVLVGASSDRIRAAIDNASFPADVPALYGDGDAAGMIASVIKTH